jgi:hypothetical protein
MHEDEDPRTNIMIKPLKDVNTVAILRSPPRRTALLNDDPLLGAPTGSGPLLSDDTLLRAPAGSGPLLNDNTLFRAPAGSSPLLNDNTLLRTPTGSGPLPSRRGHSLLNSMSRRHLSYREETYVGSRKGSGICWNHLHAHSQFSVRSCSVMHSKRTAARSPVATAMKKCIVIRWRDNRSVRRTGGQADSKERGGGCAITLGGRIYNGVTSPSSAKPRGR